MEFWKALEQLYRLGISLASLNDFGRIDPVKKGVASSTSKAAQKRQPNAAEPSQTLDKDDFESVGTGGERGSRLDFQRRIKNMMPKIKVDPENIKKGEARCPDCKFKNKKSHGCKLLTCPMTSLHHDGKSLVHYCAYCYCKKVTKDGIYEGAPLLVQTGSILRTDWSTANLSMMWMTMKIDNLVDDNGVSFMTLPDTAQGKKGGVTVTRVGRIKTKESCILDPMGTNPAACSGEYELLYEISFDAVHTSGDVPPLTVVASDFKVDST